MKIKISFWTIFIYILLIGCEDVSTEYHENSYLEIDAPSLEQSNGYYRLIFLTDYIQTFTTLQARTGNEYQKIAWTSNKEIKINNVWTNLVNSASYTDNNGEAFTALGVWEEFINDTITVYCGYNNEYNHYVDSLKVIVVEE